jgi:hypothetical protein
LDGALCASKSSPPFGDCTEAIDAASHSQSYEQAKVPADVFPDRRRKPGPKGPSTELVGAVVEMKRRNPTWGCPRIAQQIALAFQIEIDKDVVRL